MTFLLVESVGFESLTLTCEVSVVPDYYQVPERSYLRCYRQYLTKTQLTPCLFRISGP
jgi:hypothetical protein